MATNDTASSPAGWGAFDRRSLGQPPSLVQAVFGPSSDSIVVTATSTSPITTAGRGAEGRVVRQARRRPRASRRTPVTVLNTDTANFRAMVQQFTGFPSGPYSSGYRPPGGAPIINFGPGFNDPGHIQQHQYQEQHYQPQQEQQQLYQYPDTVFSLNSSSNNHNNGFLQGLNNSATSLAMADGFLFDAMSSQTMIRPTSINNRADGYFS